MGLNRHIISTLLVFTASGAYAAEAPTAQSSAVSDLASLLEGEFTTAPAPSDAAGTAQPARTLYDLAKRVQVPALGHDVVYVELREDGPTGAVRKQRLYALKLDEKKSLIVMTAYSFGHPEGFAGAYANSEPLAKLAASDLRIEPNSCPIVWHKTEAGFDGQIEPGSCGNAPPESDKTPVMSVSKTGLSEKIAAADPTIFRRLR